MQIVIITGMSGAGKSLVANCLEDLGYFCVDNMPPGLLPKFMEMITMADSRIEKIALVVDIRSGQLLDEQLPVIEEVKQMGNSVKLLFLEAENATLITRFKESRRSHPLAKRATIIRGLSSEREQLVEIRKRADILLDTSDMGTQRLRDRIVDLFADDEQRLSGLSITLVSFGFKYGIVPDSDLVFDVRFIPNPFYQDQLRAHTGKDAPVRDYVLSFSETIEFVDRLLGMLEYLIPLYQREGKMQLIVSVGCTGGRHRSVCISEKLFNSLRQAGHQVSIEHRDIDRDTRRGKV